MRSLHLFRKSLRDLQWQILCYGIGLALLAALVTAIYPSYRAQLTDFEIPEALKGLIGSADYRTAEGFLTAEFVSWVPIVTVIFAIMAGTASLGGEEANGTIDLLLSQPITRRWLALQKLAGLAVATLGIALVACLGWVVSVPFVDIEVNLGDLLLATFNIVPITLFFAFLAVFASVTFSDRRLATGAVTAFAVAAFFINYLATIVDDLQPIAWLSPFHYYDLNLLTAGADLPRSGVLIAGAVILALASIRAFDERELGVRSGLRLRVRG